jgi:hypothetical protein
MFWANYGEQIMKEVISTAILVTLIIISSNIVEVKDAIVNQKNTMDWHLRSIRYDRIYQRIVLECGQSKGPTISCVEKIKKCIDGYNNAVGEFNYEASYTLCKRVVNQNEGYEI